MRKEIQAPEERYVNSKTRKLEKKIKLWRSDSLVVPQENEKRKIKLQRIDALVVKKLGKGIQAPEERHVSSKKGKYEKDFKLRRSDMLKATINAKRNLRFLQNMLHLHDEMMGFH